MGMVMDYEREIVEIRWSDAWNSRNRGAMQINLRYAFPATAGWIRKLWKTVALDEHRKEIADGVVEWLRHQEQECADKEALRKLANAAVDAQTKAKEMQQNIDKQEHRVQTVKDYIKTLKRSEKKPYQEVLKTEKEKLKGLKEKQTSLMHTYHIKKNLFDDMQRDGKKFKGNYELIEQLSAGWQ